MGKKIDFEKAAKKQRQKKEDALWSELLKCVSSIAKMHPWNQVDSSAPFAYIPTSTEDIIFFSCVQDANNSVGLMVFPSAQDYKSILSQKMTAREEGRRFIEMENYSIYFSHAEEVPLEMQHIYRRLSLNFPDGLCPWIIHKRRGELGMPLEASELPFLLDCMGNFHMMIRSLTEGKLTPNFESGNMLLRSYSPKDKLWMNAVMPLCDLSNTSNPILIKEDSPKLQHLQTLSASNTLRRVEFDFGWLDEPVLDQPKTPPFFPMQVIFTDRQTGAVLSLYECHPKDFMDCAFTAWSEVIQKHGIPETLYLCRDESLDLFQDFTKKLGVKIKHVKRLPATERIMRDLGTV